MGFFGNKRSKAAINKDRKYFNKSQEHEVRYAKTFKRRKKTYDKYQNGGRVDISEFSVSDKNLFQCLVSVLNSVHDLVDIGGVDNVLDRFIDTHNNQYVLIIKNNESNDELQGQISYNIMVMPECKDYLDYSGVKFENNILTIPLKYNFSNGGGVDDTNWVVEFHSNKNNQTKVVRVNAKNNSDAIDKGFSKLSDMGENSDEYSVSYSHKSKYSNGGGVDDNDGIDYYDFDKKMALINLNQIHEYAVKLDNMVTEETELDEWIKMKLTRIEQNIADVAKSLEGWEKFENFADGGRIFKKQLLHIAKYAKKLMEMLESGSELMSWQENKLAVSAEYIDGIYHHLDYKMGNRASDNNYRHGGSIKDIESIKEEYEENEDNNYHSENVVLLAKHFGTEEDLEKALRILKEHQRIGYLTDELNEERYELNKKLYPMLESKINRNYATGGGVREFSAKKLHQTIENERPNSYDEFVEIIGKQIPSSYGFHIAKVYYKGYFQGVRVIISRSRGKNDIYLPSKEEVYAVTESNFPKEMVNINKYSNGGGVGKALHLQMSNLDKLSAEQSAKIFENYNKVVEIKKQDNGLYSIYTSSISGDKEYANGGGVGEKMYGFSIGEIVTVNGEDDEIVGFITPSDKENYDMGYRIEVKEHGTQSISSVSKKYSNGGGVGKNAYKIYATYKKNGVDLGENWRTVIANTEEEAVENYKKLMSKIGYTDINIIKVESKYSNGGGVGHDRMYNFLQEDLAQLDRAIYEGDKEEIDRFFSYWGIHLEKLKTKTNDRMYNFLKEDLAQLERAINEGDDEEIDNFFSYWGQHLEKLNYATGGSVSKAAWAKDRKYYNPREDYEVRYAKTHKRRKLNYKILEEGGSFDDNFDYGSDLTDESMVTRSLQDGKIHIDTLEMIIGHEPNYPYQYVGTLKLKKCFLKPYYHIA